MGYLQPTGLRKLARIEQTKFGPSEGNCFSACVATLLSIRIDEVPEFHGSNWFRDFRDWLGPRGLGAVLFDLAAGQAVADIIPRGYCLVGGDSPRRGCKHEVVYFGGKLFADPHPDGLGLLTEDDGLIVFPLCWLDWQRR